MLDQRGMINAFEYAGVEFIIVVPVSGLNEVYEFYELQNRCIYASREEEAVAIASGLSIAGKLPLVLVQQSGVGNMLNAYIGLAEGYDIYFPILVFDRGIYDENPIQAISSKFTIPIIATFKSSVNLCFTNSQGVIEFSSGVINKTRWFITEY